MTREQKLALIIGFSLVLVVGVLISDHFSRARTDPLGSAIGEGATRIDSVALVEEEPPIDEAWVRDPLRAPTSIVMGSGPEEDPAGDLIEDPVTQPSLTGPALSQQATIQEPRPIQTPITTVEDPLAEMFEPVGPQPQTASAAEARPQPQPTLASERWHVVAREESLWRIAERHYGDGAKWTKIRDRNPTLISDEGEVHAGARIAIPLDPSTAATAPSATPPTSPRATPASHPKSEPGKKTQGRTYVVKKGDSLGEIAQRELGSARRWPEIVKLNEIDDPDDVPAGVELRLPPA